MTRLTYTTQELVQVSYAHMTLSSPFSPPAQTDNPQYPPLLTQIQPPQKLSVDGSWPIFSQYLEMAKEEDERMTDNWKADADGIIIFVRHYNILYPALHLRQLIDSSFTDRSILSCCRILDLSVYSGPSTGPTGRLQFLPRQYLSGYD